MARNAGKRRDGCAIVVCLNDLSYCSRSFHALLFTNKASHNAPSLATHFENKMWVLVCSSCHFLEILYPSSETLLELSFLIVVALG